MPIFMDVHQSLGDASEEDIKAAHQRDLDIQDQYGVEFLTFWFNSPGSEAFCLVDAPTKEAVIEVHKQAHGLVPHDIIEVEKPTVTQFMGDWEKNVPYIATNEDSEIDSGLRAVMFTDLVGSTQISSREGDVKALEVLATHDQIVREALSAHAGREVKHTGDGILASFTYVSRAVDAAVQIQRQFGEPNDADSDDGRVRIGISAGEPVDQHEDLYGAVVNLASRICGRADPGQILASSAVRELSVGKPITFADKGPVALKGFDDPVRLFDIPLNQTS